MTNTNDSSPSSQETSPSSDTDSNGNNWAATLKDKAVLVAILCTIISLGGVIYNTTFSGSYSKDIQEAQAAEARAEEAREKRGKLYRAFYREARKCLTYSSELPIVTRAETLDDASATKLYHQCQGVHDAYDEMLTDASFEADDRALEVINGIDRITGWALDDQLKMFRALDETNQAVDRFRVAICKDTSPIASKEDCERMIIPDDFGKKMRRNWNKTFFRRSLEESVTKKYYGDTTSHAWAVSFTLSDSLSFVPDSTPSR